MGCGPSTVLLGLLDPASFTDQMLKENGVTNLTPFSPFNTMRAPEYWSAFKHLIIPDMRRDREVQAQSAINARSIIYGMTRVGNTIAYAETNGSKKENLHILNVFAAHEINSFEELYFDDKLVANASGTAPIGWSGAWVSGAWSIQAPYVGKVTLVFHDGTQTVADSSMVAASAGGWTSNHKLLGVAYTHITLVYDEGVFPAGLPTIKAVIKGKRVLDTRTNIIAFSSNPAMCIRDFMLMSIDEGGMGCKVDEIDEPSFLAAANICDELVESMIPLDANGNPVTPGVKAVSIASSSTLESRYTLNGVIKLDGAPTQFVKDMLTSCAGEALYTGDKWKLYVGSPSSSVETIDESWLNGGISFQTGSNSNDKTNTGKGTFANSNDFWADTEFPEVPIGISTPPNSSYWSLSATPTHYDSTATYSVDQYATFASKVYKSFTSVPINKPPPDASYWVLVELHDNSLQYPSGHILQRNGSVYTSTTTVPVSNPYLAEDAGQVLTANLSLPFTITSSEAQRLAKIAVKKSRSGFTLSYPCNHKAFGIDVMDVITVNNSLLNISKDFRVISWGFSMTGGTSLGLAEYDPETWDWSASDSTPLVAPIINNLPDPFTITAPTTLAVSDAQVTYTGDVTRSETTFSWVNTSAQATKFIIQLDGNDYITIITTSYVFTNLVLGSHTFGVKASNTNGIESSLATITHTVASTNGVVTGISVISANYIPRENSTGTALETSQITSTTTGVGISVATPTAKLHLAAGSTTASTSPLKFNSGALNTTAEVGAVEFLTDAFYGTVTTGAVRKQFAFTSDIPASAVKATGAEINTGTDDAKFVTAKAITDSNVAFLADIPANVVSGTYTPTATNITNITSSTPNNSSYQQIGNIITVFGSITITNTLAVASQVDMSLPVASNLANATELNGTGTMDSTASVNLYIKGEVTNDRASIYFTSAGVGQTSTIYYSFQYKII